MGWPATVCPDGANKISAVSIAVAIDNRDVGQSSYAASYHSRPGGSGRFLQRPPGAGTSWASMGGMSQEWPWLHPTALVVLCSAAGCSGRLAHARRFKLIRQQGPTRRPSFPPAPLGVSHEFFRFGPDLWLMWLLSQNPTRRSWTVSSAAGGGRTRLAAFRDSLPGADSPGRRSHRRRGSH